MKIKYIVFCIVIVFITLSIKYAIVDTNIIVNKKELFGKNDDVKVLEKYGYIPGYSCKKISVLDEDGKYQGTYDFEDYVARVVSGETFILDDETTFEAMSIAIRTYALYVTNNCRTSIKNSEAHQVMSDIVSDKIRKAVSKTKGKVLILNNKLVKAEYDSFYMGDGYYCDKKFCYSNYYRVGNDSTNPKSHKIKVPATWIDDLSGGHGNGMSQYGALYLSSQGYSYEKILKYFYADGVEIGTTIKPNNTDGLKLDNKFVTRVSRPLRKNYYYYVKDTAPKGSLEGESTWYATSRANEILKSVNSSKRISYFDDSSKYCNLVNFNKSNDYTKPKVGSIISWGNHLAIVEKVNKDTVDITEAYTGLGYYGNEYSFEMLNEKGKFYNKKTNGIARKYNCEENKSGCFKRTNNIKISDLKNRWGYDFVCYIYLID